MQKWSQPLIWGMVIAVIGPITASYFGLVFSYFGSLTVLGIAALLWILYFYAIYLLCTRPHDERFVQIYMLVMSILMLPWDPLDRKSGSAGMPRPISYAVFCLKKNNVTILVIKTVPLIRHEIFP